MCVCVCIKSNDSLNKLCDQEYTWILILIVI